MGLKLSSAVFGTKVWIVQSGEVGTITGFAMHQRQKAKQFFVEYKAADGRATNDWFYEDQLSTEEA